MKNENNSSSINHSKKNKESSPKKQLNYSFTKEFINIISLNEEDEEGNPSLRYIDDEEEYEAASDAFDEYLDTVEFDEIIDEEED